MVIFSKTRVHYIINYRALFWNGILGSYLKNPKLWTGRGLLTPLTGSAGHLCLQSTKDWTLRRAWIPALRKNRHIFQTDSRLKDAETKNNWGMDRYGYLWNGNLLVQKLIKTTDGTSAAYVKLVGNPNSSGAWVCRYGSSWSVGRFQAGAGLQQTLGAIGAGWRCQKCAWHTCRLVQLLDMNGVSVWIA